VFGGPNRKLSEKYKLYVYLCQRHHTGNKGIHFNPQMALRYKQEYQEKFEQQYSRELFVELFGKNYLGVHE